MVLESTMICVDNSDYMRNGDYSPTRLQAEQDAISLVCHAKTSSNPENSIGLLTFANGELLASLTTELGRVLTKLYEISPSGYINFISGIRIAQLALKHRQGRHHKMRIVAFVGSPIDCDNNDMTELAKKLKKEKINVDVVSFGEEVDNELLRIFINTLNGKEEGTSHLVSVPPGLDLSGVIIETPVVQGEDGMGGAGLGRSDSERYMGFDSSEDPDLALALKMSLDEEKMRQDNAAANVAPANTTTANEEDNEMAMLEKALAKAMKYANMTEEEQIAFAIQISMQDSQNPDAALEARTEDGVKTDRVQSDHENVSGSGSKSDAEKVKEKETQEKDEKEKDKEKKGQ